MPLGLGQRLNLIANNPAALAQYETEQERMRLGRRKRQDTRIAEIALKVLEQAPQGSKARALAVSTLSNLGYQAELIEGLRPTTAQAEPIKLGARERLIDPTTRATLVPALPPAPQPPQSGAEERIMRLVAELRIKQQNEGLTAFEQEWLTLNEEALMRQVDPVRAMQQQMLGQRPGTTARGTRTPRTQELTAGQQREVDLARQAIEAGTPAAPVIQRLKQQTGLTDEQLRAMGFANGR